MATNDVCPRCARPALLEIKLFSGRGHSCQACRGLLLDFQVVATLFDGLMGRTEPAAGGVQCRSCRIPMSHVRFGDDAPLLLCELHGVLLAPEDRALLPASLRRRLRWRERLARLFGGSTGASGGNLDAVAEIAEVVTGDASDGGDTSGGGDASCGGGND